MRQLDTMVKHSHFLQLPQVSVVPKKGVALSQYVCSTYRLTSQMGEIPGIQMTESDNNRRKTIISGIVICTFTGDLQDDTNDTKTIATDSSTNMS